MKSIWNNIEKPTFETQKGDIKTDVLIIGGGICGVLCVYTLKARGVDCVLVEAGEICSGITEKTTAKITFQHGVAYSKIADRYGIENAKLYYESQKNAFNKLCAIASSIDDNFEMCNSFVYSPNDFFKIEKELNVMQKIGCKASFCKKTELPFDIAGAIKVQNQAHFHPLKFIYTIAKDLKIYENTRVLEITPQEVITNRGRIFAKKIIVATHFPFVNKHGAYFLKMYQHRSYVLALKNAPKYKDMYVDASQTGLSFRAYKDLLLLGGSGHRTGKKGGGW